MKFNTLRLSFTTLKKVQKLNKYKDGEVFFVKIYIKMYTPICLFMRSYKILQ